MRTLAVDPGTRRVGLALSDEGGKWATPYAVLEIQSESEAIERIIAIIGKEGVERIAIGLPLNMDGRPGPAAEASFAMGKTLQGQTGKPVIYLDERLSSFQAEQTLNDRKRGGEKLTRAGKKRRLDAIAAVVFLQDFLDGKVGAISPP
jgi:putative Holliday junction resolvase